MKTILKLALAVSAASTLMATTAYGEGLTIGVSWSNFQEERWKTDEAAIKGALEAAGAKYISADAQSSSAKQLSDVEALIAQGANALIILAQDSQAIGPAVQAAADEGIPVVGYDRLIEDPRAFYLTFDNKEVGRVIARSIYAEVPQGNYAIIKGDKGDPGVQGVAGSNGAKGTKGEAGATGAVGDKGDAGVAGTGGAVGGLVGNAVKDFLWLPHKGLEGLLVNSRKSRLNGKKKWEIKERKKKE